MAEEKPEILEIAEHKLLEGEGDNLAYLFGAIVLTVAFAVTLKFCTLPADVRAAVLLAYGNLMGILYVKIRGEAKK